MTEKIAKYKAKVITKWFQTIFMSIWTIMCIVIFFVLLVGLYQHPNRISDLWFIGIVILLASFLSTNYLTWQLKGQEILILNDKTLELRNKGTFFTKILRINYFEIDNIISDTDKETPWWIKFWGIGGGKIRIEYLGRKRRFGQDLTMKQAKSMTEKIKMEFDKRKTNANKMYNS
jgi:hypothetical protein